MDSFRRALNAPITSRLRVAVFASGRGSNFQAIIEAQRSGELAIDVVVLCSDKPASRAVATATQDGIPSVALDAKKYTHRAEFDYALFDRAAEFQPDLIVLAGFMRVIDEAIVERWRGRMINIHPSLLPKYPGLRTHQRALDGRDRVHGASVHFVTPELDGGPVIAQTELTIGEHDDAAKLASRLLPLEHRLLIASIRLIATQRVRLDASSVLFDGRPLSHPLKMREDDELHM
ncbi:MAG: phosphoribosylglycinamide formyltransferase [Rudaea sp.]